MCNHDVINSSPIVTPRLFTVLVTGTVTPATVTSSICGSDLCLAVVPMTIASVLPGCRQSRWRPTNGLETVVDNAECLVSAESDV